MKPLEALRPLIGHWRTSGEVIGDKDDVVGQIAGTDTYELLPGIPWIAHLIDVDMPDGHVSGFELIGGAHPDGGWSMHAFDASSQPSAMRLTDEGVGLLLIHGEGVRSWLSTAAGEHHMEARWERLVGDEWRAWMNMRFDRAEPRSLPASSFW